MFFEFLNRLLSLDLNWLIGLIANNLLWLFAFTMLIYLFFDGKKVIAGVIVFALAVWIWSDFQLISGVAVFAGGFLAIYYMSKIAVMAFAEDTPELRNKLIWVSEIQALAVLVLYNIFWVH